MEKENTFCGGEEEQRRKRKENIIEEEQIMRDGLMGIKGSARNPRRSKNTVKKRSYERRYIEKQMFIAKNAIQKNICRTQTFSMSNQNSFFSSDF